MRRAVFYNPKLKAKVIVDIEEETFESIKATIPNKEFECISQIGIWVLQNFNKEATLQKLPIELDDDKE